MLGFYYTTVSMQNYFPFGTYSLVWEADNKQVYINQTVFNSEQDHKENKLHDILVREEWEGVEIFQMQQLRQTNLGKK